MSVFILARASPWGFRVEELLPFAYNLTYHALTTQIDVFLAHSVLIFQLFGLDWICWIVHVKFSTVRYEAYGNRDTKI